MKSFITKTCIALCTTLVVSCTTTAQTSSGLGSLLNQLGGSATSSATSSDNSSAVSSAIGSLLSGVLNLNKELTVADLQGTWAYSAPSCKFQSENLLKKAGGAVVASQLSSKLDTYYQKLGFTSSRYSYTFDSEGSFTMNYGKLPLKGSVSKSEKADYFQFEFVKLGSYALATTPAYIEISGNTMQLLYEADKFIALFRSLAGTLGISTLDSIFSLLDGYDGVLIGFELTKQN